MDLRNSKRKLSVLEAISCKKVSFPLSKDQSHSGASEEDSFYSCTSNNPSLPSNVTEPKAFLEGTESFDHITIVVDPNNPGIMPQEVTVYGYENALFAPNIRKRANKVMFSRNLSHNMSNLYLSPQKLTYTSNESQPFSKRITTQNVKSTSGINLLGDSDHKHQVTSWQTEFMNGRKYRDERGMNLIPPCTQTFGHKIDPISKYVLTPNSDSGYLSNIQFNCTSFLPGKQTQKLNSHSINTKQNLRTQKVSNMDEGALPDNWDKNQPMKNTFECTLCLLTFSKLTLYLTHIRSHIVVDTLVCQICEKLISSVSKIPNHISMHAGMKVFLCIFCSAVFYNYNNLRVHLSQRKDGIVYSCQRCPMEFCSKSGIVKHKQIHIGHQFKCNICSMIFKRAYDLKLHIRKFHNESKKEFSKLSAPRKQIQTKYRLKRRKVIGRTKVANPSKNTKHCTSFLCPFCSREFLRAKYLRSHIRNNICKKNASINSLLNEDDLHQNLEMSVKESESPDGIYVCPHCSKDFSNEIFRKLHLRNRVCQLNTSAESSYMDESELSQNLDLSSIEIDPPEVFPVCPCCTKVFKGERHLRRHLSHGMCKKLSEISAKNEYLCPYCSIEVDCLETHVCSNTSENNLAENGGPLNANNIPFQSLLISSRSSSIHEHSHICPHCKKVFSNRKVRDNHKTHCFPSKNTLVTNGLIKNEYSDLEVHCVTPKETRIKTEADYTCDYCNESFLHTFQKHVRSHGCSDDNTAANHSNCNVVLDRKRFTCATCNIVMGSLVTLRRHELSGKCKAPINKTVGKSSFYQTKIITPQKKCEKIEKTPLREDSDNPSSISSSTSEKLSDPREIPMQPSLATRNQLYYSLNTKQAKHEGKLKRLNPEKQIPQLSCLYCIVKFRTLKAFKSHLELNSCTNVLSRFRTKCSACDRDFSTAANLRRHVKSYCTFFKN